MHFWSLLIQSFLLCAHVSAVKTELFKTCAQSGFCTRNRHFAREVSKSQNYESRYAIDTESLKFDETAKVLTGDIVKQVPQRGNGVVLPFRVEILVDNNVRLQVDEKLRTEKPDKSVWPHTDLQFRRFNEAWKYVLQRVPKPVSSKVTYKLDNGEITLAYGEFETKISTKSVKLEIWQSGNLLITVNERGFLNVEHFRVENENAANMLPEESDFNAFHDTFRDSQGDSLKFGPESVGLDVSFHGCAAVYGIPEHADTFALKNTEENGDPYRLFNVDIFEYETSSRFPMYGSIPFLVGRNAKTGAGLGVLWINGADTYVDISESKKSHWFSENGIIDVILTVAPSLPKITEQYANLSGKPDLPQLFALGYHQCRWNYNDVDDVLDVSSQFDKSQIPYDVIWLDVEYTENKKYFTWKPGMFDGHEAMNKKLDETGRKLVAIIDPHLKTGYDISDKVINEDLAVKNSDNSGPFKGHCWPGESVWIDTFNPKAREHWTQLFANNTQFAGDETNLHIWNDMAEPSVFSGPETTAPKDLVHYGGWEHRSVHNIYGMTFHEATYDALVARYGNKRPFVLTRAYYAGSQRTAAMWSGDNRSKWEFLKASIPMVLTSQVVGMPFTGADVGGFFGNPTEELLTRWYQTGIFYPFFRAHAHIDSKRREPYLFHDPYLGVMRDTIRLRYRLLPLLYTQFYHASTTGTPVLTPMVYKNPENEAVATIEDQFFLGPILAKPVTEEGAKSQSIYFPDNKVYYDFETFAPLRGEGVHNVAAPLSKVPMYVQSGGIVPLKNRYRRSAKAMKYDPYTLVVALDDDKSAFGDLYVDDGETFAYRDGDYTYVTFAAQNGTLSSRVEAGTAAAGSTGARVEKIVLLGGNEYESAHIVEDSGKRAAELAREGSYVVVRNPGVRVGQNWHLVFA